MQGFTTVAGTAGSRTAYDVARCRHRLGGLWRLIIRARQGELIVCAQPGFCVKLLVYELEARLAKNMVDCGPAQRTGSASGLLAGRVRYMVWRQEGYVLPDGMAIGTPMYKISQDMTPMSRRTLWLRCCLPSWCFPFPETCLVPTQCLRQRGLFWNNKALL